MSHPVSDVSTVLCVQGTSEGSGAVIVVGIDAHKGSHTLVAVDVSGRRLACKSVPSTSAGHLQAIRWASGRFGDEVRWAVEDCRGVTRRLEADLLEAGVQVVRVPARMMARTRAAARTVGKSDPIDALAVAQAALRDPTLPVATRDDDSRAIKLLLDRRERLIEQRIATNNRLLWRLHELDPEFRVASRALRHQNHRRTVTVFLESHQGLIAELGRAELADIARLSEEAGHLERRIAVDIRARAPHLLSIRGCGDLSAARIVAETAGVHRFSSEAAFARFAGVAPTPAWSGATEGRVRYIKTGNRRVNAALHRIAITQLRDGEGAVYYQKRLEQGDSVMSALRCLKRRIARRVYGQMRLDAGLARR